jgi:hypothetical protein
MRLLGQAATYAGAIFQALEHALIEYQRIKLAMSKSKTPLDYQQLIEATKTEYPLLSEALSRAEVERYELGKLWVRAGDHADRGTLLLFSGLLKSVLEAQQQIPVKIRVKEHL